MTTQWIAGIHGPRGRSTSQLFKLGLTYLEHVKHSEAAHRITIVVLPGGDVPSYTTKACINSSTTYLSQYTVQSTPLIAPKFGLATPQAAIADLACRC